MARKKKLNIMSSPFHMSTRQAPRLEGIKMTEKKSKKPSMKSQMKRVRVVKSTPY